MGLKPHLVKGSIVSGELQGPPNHRGDDGGQLAAKLRSVLKRSKNVQRLGGE